MLSFSFTTLLWKFTQKALEFDGTFTKLTDSTIPVYHKRPPRGWPFIHETSSRYIFAGSLPWP